jgi:sec-independent protein translocase protein TatA
MNTIGFIGNLGGPDMLIILALALMFFGAKRLPELAKGLGQAVSEFNKAKDDVHRQISTAADPVVKPAEGIQARQTSPVVAPVAAEPAPAVAAAASVPSETDPKPQA